MGFLSVKHCDRLTFGRNLVRVPGREPSLSENQTDVSDGFRGRAKRAAAAIRGILEKQISEGILPPGARLAPERALAAQFGASRAVVRSAVTGLVDSGQVVRHVGRGSFVADPRRLAKPAKPVFTDIAPAEMMEFRCQLEPAMIDLIMLNARNGDIEAICDCVTEGDGAANRAEWNAHDDRFHRLMAAATHNGVIIALYDAFSAARRESAWSRLKKKTVNPELWREFQAQHRQIADALRRGDRDDAFRATRDHIMRARAVMLGYAVSATAAELGDD
jgi:DNA-binding FadR family transcriptional regulator